MELERKQGLVVDVFSGAGLGLLLGVIMGMAHSPVVAIVAGAITSVLAVFLGLEGGDSKLSALANVRLNGVRIGSFALATVIGLFLGLYVRINNPLVESPMVQLQRWHEAFPIKVAPLKPTTGLRYAADADEARRNRTLARQLMVFERTGLKPASLDFGGILPKNLSTKSIESSKGSNASGSEAQASAFTPVELSETAGSRLAILFGKENESNVCRDLSPDEYTRNGKVNVTGWASAFEVEGFTGVFEMVYAADDSDKEQLLNAAHKLLCDLSNLAKEEQQ
jgi:hypothetical protein